MYSRSTLSDPMLYLQWVCWDCNEFDWLLTREDLSSLEGCVSCRKPPRLSFAEM